MAQKLACRNTASSVAKFYDNKKVFITGGTGFLGKVIVEKLLRSCPGVSNIYLLVRPKREKTIEERIHEAISSPVFDVIRKENPTVLSKVLPIEGDISLPKLGINENDRELLSKSVNVVFHSAATIKFNDNLKRTARLNLIGTQQVAKLCREISDLKAFVHVSTAYCNPQRFRVEEKVYPSSIEPDKLVSTMESLDEDAVDAITPKLIGDFPNTYSFTKQLAERWLADNKGDLPTVIVRPSGILSSLEEPMKGWLDNWAGNTGVAVAAAQGLLKTVICDKQKRPDIIPVDIVSNLIIVSAWKAALSKTSEVPVYHCSSGQRNPINNDQHFSLCAKYFRIHKVSNFNWYYDDGFMTLSRIVFTIKNRVPAYLTDFFLRITGKQPTMIKKQDIPIKVASVLEYFLVRDWEFLDDNFKALSSSLSEEDKKLFNMDVESINWEDYHENYVLGIKKYLLKQQ